MRWPECVLMQLIHAAVVVLSGNKFAPLTHREPELVSGSMSIRALAVLDGFPPQWSVSFRLGLAYSILIRLHPGW